MHAENNEWTYIVPETSVTYMFSGSNGYLGLQSVHVLECARLLFLEVVAVPSVDLQRGLTHGQLLQTVSQFLLQLSKRGLQTHNIASFSHWIIFLLHYITLRLHRMCVPCWEVAVYISSAHSVDQWHFILCRTAELFWTFSFLCLSKM